MGLEKLDYQPASRFKDGYAFLAWLAEKSHKQALRRSATPFPSYSPLASLLQRFRKLAAPYRLYDYPGPTSFLATILGYKKTTIERALKRDGDRHVSGIMARKSAEWLRIRARQMLELASDFERHATEREAGDLERRRAPGLLRYHAQMAKEGKTHPGRLAKHLRPPSSKLNKSKPSKSATNLDK